MAPVRVRHAKGVETIEISLDDDAVTVASLQQRIYALSGIPPSRQQRALVFLPDIIPSSSTQSRPATLPPCSPLYLIFLYQALA